MDGFKKDISMGNFYTNILMGAGIGFAITISVLFLMAVLMIIADIGNEFSSPLSSIALGIGSLAGAFISAYRNEKKGFICGIINATAIFILVFVVGLIINREMTMMTFFHFIITLLASLIGGILGVNKAASGTKFKVK